MRTRQNSILLIAVAAAVPYGVLLQGFLGGSWYTFFHPYSLGMVFGLSAWFLFCASLLLAARVRFLERRLGQDRLLGLHRYAALSGMVLGCLHAAFKTFFFPEFTVAHYTGGAGFGLILLLAIPSAVVMAAMVPDRPVWLGRCKQRIRSAVRYSAMKGLHNLLPAAVAILMVHVLLAAPTAENRLRPLLILATGLPALSLWLDHKVLRPLRAARGTITQVAALSPSLLSVSFRISRPLRAIPGQFGYFRVRSPRTGREEHPLTFAAPLENRNGELVVRREGRWTEALAFCSAGSEIRLDGPYGAFTFDEERPMLWIAGGVGITPFCARIRAAAQGSAPLRHPVTLLWSAATAQEMPFREEFLAYAAGEHRFCFIPYLTRESGGRRLTPPDIAAALRVLEEAGGAPCSVWFCGSRPLRAVVKAACVAAGVFRGRFHYEDFSV
ncbi:MAG: hypothetical protein JXB25_07405 [Deltaproteobacteria bacterium]|nr:hypothetical protein [Deltaproteobacteria bacterium]